jgi:hypothetical protein
MQMLHAGKKYNSCRHGDCQILATYGPWDDIQKIFSARLCLAHFQQAISSSEAADESVHLYINASRATQLKTGA